MVSKEYQNRTCPCCYAVYLGTVPKFNRKKWVQLKEDTPGNCPVCGLTLAAGKVVPLPWSKYSTGKLFPIVHPDGTLDVYGERNVIRAYYQIKAKKSLEREEFEVLYDTKYKDFRIRNLGPRFL